MVVRKRLIFWLIRAYIKKSGKVILLSFLAGLLIFFMILFFSNFLKNLVPVYKKSVIGVSGVYSKDNLPPFVMEKISSGLTVVTDSGEIKPSLADSWQTKDKGKTYIFHLKDNQYFSDGRKVVSGLVNYNFKDVKIDRPDESTIIFKLKNTYAPFLITVSRPIFQPGFVGVGEYKINDIKLNGDFIQSMEISKVKNKFDIITYVFYPSTEALKYAYVLGEVNQAIGLDAAEFKNISYEKFKNTEVVKRINYNKLVTLFYNNNDNILSDKKARLALSYTLPDKYSEGEKAFLPYSPRSVYYNKEIEEKTQNYAHAKLLFSASSVASGSASGKEKIDLTIKTLPKYIILAEKLAKNFTEVGLRVSVEQVNNIPTDFQIYLGDFVLSKDPDQYLLWHSDQPKNITKYKNLRIDKLLEDGRNTDDIRSRKKIYADFQKFLIDDVPASFLYFPQEYDVIRK